MTGTKKYESFGKNGVVPPEEDQRFPKPVFFNCKNNSH